MNSDWIHFSWKSMDCFVLRLVQWVKIKKLLIAVHGKIIILGLRKAKTWDILIAVDGGWCSEGSFPPNKCFPICGFKPPPPPPLPQGTMDSFLLPNMKGIWTWNNLWNFLTINLKDLYISQCLWRLTEATPKECIIKQWENNCTFQTKAWNLTISNGSQF